MCGLLLGLLLELLTLVDCAAGTAPITGLIDFQMFCFRPGPSYHPSSYIFVYTSTLLHVDLENVLQAHQLCVYLT